MTFSELTGFGRAAPSEGHDADHGHVSAAGHEHQEASST
jgi:hypothetical protein